MISRSENPKSENSCSLHSRPTSGNHSKPDCGNRYSALAHRSFCWQSPASTECSSYDVRAWLCAPYLSIPARNQRQHRLLRPGSPLPPAHWGKLLLPDLSCFWNCCACSNSMIPSSAGSNASRCPPHKTSPFNARRAHGTPPARKSRTNETGTPWHRKIALSATSQCGHTSKSARRRGFIFKEIVTRGDEVTFSTRSMRSRSIATIGSLDLYDRLAIARR